MADIKQAIADYESLLSRIASRPGVKELSEYLVKHGLFRAPASTKFHLCVEGGLVIHTVSVAKTALKVKSEMLPDMPDESVILCALFHDAHKVTDGFGNQTYIKNDKYNSAKDISNFNKPFEWNTEQLSFSGGHKSLLLVAKFVSLTKHEMQAIAYHDGPYVPSWEDIQYSAYPLTLLLHFSDLWSTQVIEKGQKPAGDNALFLENK